MKIYPGITDMVGRLLMATISALCVVPWSATVNVKPAYACSCLPAGPPLTALDQATAVFSGQVSDIKRTTTEVEVSFNVTEVWKGELTPTLVINTGPHSAACGYPFEIGQDYLIYAHGRNNTRLGASLCSRTTLLSNAEADLVELGDGAPPTLKDPYHQKAASRLRLFLPLKDPYHQKAASYLAYSCPAGPSFSNWTERLQSFQGKSATSSERLRRSK